MEVECTHVKTLMQFRIVVTFKLMTCLSEQGIDQGIDHCTVKLVC